MEKFKQPESPIRALEKNIIKRLREDVNGTEELETQKLLNQWLDIREAEVTNKKDRESYERARTELSLDLARLLFAGDHKDNATLVFNDALCQAVNEGNDKLIEEISDEINLLYAS